MQVISIVVPTHNELPNIEPLYRRIAATFGELPRYDFELIFCDDSSDETAREIARLHLLDSRVKLIRLSRRFSQSVAISAGVDRCIGEAVVLMDADLQDPPEALPRLLELWQAGNEIVYVQRESGAQYPLYKAFSQAFYRVLRRWASIEIPTDAGEFRLLDAKVVQFLKGLREHTRFLRGLTVWPGLRQASIKIERKQRSQGRSNYNFARSFLVAVDGIVSFSIVPLRLATLVGAIIATVSFVVGTAYIISRILYPQIFGSGWTSLFVGMTFMGGVQLMFLGVLGEYIGRIYTEVQNRPLYWVDFELGFDTKQTPNDSRAIQAGA